MTDLQQLTVDENGNITGLPSGSTLAPIRERELSDSEKAAMDKARELGADGIGLSPVSIFSVFNFINSVKYGGKGIFARIETASESSKYKTGSEILVIYLSDPTLFNIAERVHGRKLAELQFDNEGYLCEDMPVPYRPQPAYYSYGYSKASLMTWDKLTNIDEISTADFVTALIIRLRYVLMKDICQSVDAIIHTHDSVDRFVSSGAAKKHFKQIFDEVEKHVKRSW